MWSVGHPSATARSRRAYWRGCTLCVLNDLLQGTLAHVQVRLTLQMTRGYFQGTHRRTSHSMVASTWANAGVATTGPATSGWGGAGAGGGAAQVASIHAGTPRRRRMPNPGGCVATAPIAQARNASYWSRMVAAGIMGAPFLSVGGPVRVRYCGDGRTGPGAVGVPEPVQQMSRVQRTLEAQSRPPPSA